MEPDDREDEYSYPPEGKSRPVATIDLTGLGVQLPPASKRRQPTTRIYDAPLDDAAFARIRARVKKARKA